MTWTEERVEILKKLWIDGMSAAKIAGHFGDGISRNAVIGKVHRLGLSDKDRPIKKSQHRNRSKKATSSNLQNRVKVTSHVIGNTVLKTVVDEKTNLEVRYEAPQFVEIYIPPEQRKSVLTITETTCKWPIGDPTEEDFYFCGSNIDDEETYCKYHSSIAYQGSKKRK